MKKETPGVREDKEWREVIVEEGVEDPFKKEQKVKESRKKRGEERRKRNLC